MSNLSYHAGTHFSVRSYFDQRAHSFDTGSHQSNSVKFVYTESGHISYEIAPKEGKKIQKELKAGDLILISANTPHRLAVSKAARLILLELNASGNDDGKSHLDAKTVLDNCPSLKKAFQSARHIVINDFSYVRQTLNRLIALLNTNKLGYIDHFFTEVLIGELFLNVDENYTKTYLDNPYVGLIVEFIARNYQENISVKAIAEAVNLNPSYMQKLFAKHMGNTVYDYLTQFRLNQAISLMKNTNMAFEDIAQEVGFNNRQTFFNSFKAFTTYTPKLFKKYLASPVSSFQKDPEEGGN